MDQKTSLDDEVNEHLAFTRAVVQSIRLDQAERALLDEAMAAVEGKMADPSHYLAVIGEFSSGKSTFVNALLGEELLPASADATTASALRIRAGRRRVLSFQLADDAHGHVLTESGGAWSRTCGPPSPGSSGIRWRNSRTWCSAVTTAPSGA